MMGFLLGILYGLAFIGGSFLTYVWGRVYYLASRQSGTCDSQLCWISIGLTVGSFANVLIFGYRTFQNLVYGPDPRLSSTQLLILVVGLLGLALSKTLLMWAYERDRHSLTWRAFTLLSAAWIISSPAWLLSLEDLL